MLGAAEPDAFGAELPATLHPGDIGVGADFQFCGIASAQPMKMPNSTEISGSISGTDPENAARGPIDRHPVVFLNVVPLMLNCLFASPHADIFAAGRRRVCPCAATTAAWEVIPAACVKIPFAASMP